MSNVTIFLLCFVAIFIGMNAILMDEVCRQRDEIRKLKEILKVVGEVLRDGNKDK